MPAVPLALAEIEERLEEIRYLLNRRSLLSVLAPAVGVLLGLSALLVWSASRATPGSFSLALYAATAAAVVFIAWSGLALWQRWLSVEDACRLADERGRMQQRLATALWLAHARTQPAMAAVLVSDTLEHRASWQAAAIVPRRFPFELVYPLAGAFALAAALFFASRMPLDGLDTIARPAKAPHPFEKPPREQPPQPEQQGESEPLLTNTGIEDSGGGQTALGAGRDAAKAAGMSEQVRGAIRQALDRFQQTERARDLPKGNTGQAGSGTQNSLGAQQIASARQHSSGAAPDGNSPPDGSQDAARQETKTGQQRPGLAPDENDGGESGVTRGKKPPGQDARDNAAESAPEAPQQAAGGDPRDGRRTGEGDPRRPEAKAGKQGTMPGPQKPQQAQDGEGTQGTESDKPADSGANSQNQLPKSDQTRDGAKGTSKSSGGPGGKQSGGAHAAAGPGTELEGLFAAKGTAGTEIARAPTSGTFKLTLGSFLASSGGNQEKPKNTARVPGQSGRAAVAEPPSLNPNQTADDALRRADIPPEYEEIVRRIYSSRPAK